MAGVKFQKRQLATPPDGTIVAVDPIGGEDFQLMKVVVGDIGTDDGPVSTANPMPTIPGDGVAVDEVAGEKFQQIKITLGDDGADDGTVSAANPIPVTDVSVSTDMEGGGIVVVGTTAVAVTFTGVTKSIIISADIANTGTLYVGKSNVTNAGLNAFTYLEAGETLTIEYDDATNAVYVVASIAAQNFWKGALV